jgi:hypothetical protein
LALVVVVWSAWGKGGAQLPPLTMTTKLMCGDILTFQPLTGMVGGGDNDDSPPGRTANAETRWDQHNNDNKDKNVKNTVLLGRRW